MYIHILIFSVSNGSYVVNYICIIMLDMHTCICIQWNLSCIYSYVSGKSLVPMLYFTYEREGGEERGREEGREGASERHKLWHKTVYAGVCT